jgi:hypothetical protein
MKYFLLLIVVVGAAFYFPDSRAWIVERAQPVVNPMLRTATQSEMDKIQTDLQQFARENLGRYPDSRQFLTWLEDTYSGGGSRDSWGTPYQLEDLRRDRRMQIRSWGPDRIRDTGDDLLLAFQREGR